MTTDRAASTSAVSSSSDTQPAVRASSSGSRSIPRASSSRAKPVPGAAEAFHNLSATAPLLPAAVGMVLGVAMDARAALPFGLYVVVVLACGPVLYAVRRWWIACGVITGLAAIGVGGALHHAAYRRTSADAIVLLTSRRSVPATVSGTIATEPSLRRPDFGGMQRWVPDPPRTRFLLDVESVDGVDGPIRARGLVSVSVKEPVLRLAAGDRVRVVGFLYRPRPPDNDGEPDWPQIQRRRGVLASMSAEHAACVTRLGAPRADAGWLTAVRQRCRRYLLDDVATRDPSSVSLLEALILGQRSTVDRAINDAFVATGTVHFLSVSGAHLGMLGAAVWALASLLGRSRRQAAVVVTAVVVAYALLAEPNPPVFRSAILAVLLGVGLMLRRPVRTANWLAASVILILAVRPTDLFDPGFQLSYVTLLGVIYLSPSVRATWRAVFARRGPALAMRGPVGPRPWLRGVAVGAAGRLEWALAVSMAAWLIGAPLSLYHFGQTSTWGWINSALIAPGVALLMLLGFVKLVAGAILSAAGAALAPAVGAATAAMDAWVRVLAAIPGTSFLAPSPPAWLVVAWTVALSAWAARAYVRLPRHGIAVGLLAAVTASAWWYWPGRPADDAVRVRVLSVGDGMASIVRLPNGRALLCDFGRMPPYEMFRGTIRPAFGLDGVRRIDAAIVSHPNLDHYSALPDTARAVPMREVWVTSYFVDTASRGGPSRFVLDELRRQGVAVRTLHAGDRLTNTGGVEAEVLWPPPHEAGAPYDANDVSLVLRLRYGGRSMLFCGDIERGPQAWLLRHADLHADVLVLPHHGSLKPWTPDFVEAVAPTVVIRSTGTRDDASPAGLRELVKPYRYYSTAEVGGVVVEFGPRGIAVTPHHAPEPP